MKNKRYCYLEPVYPEKGFVVAFFVYGEGKLQKVITLPSLYEDLREASADIVEVLKDVNLEVVQVPKEAMLLPVHFHSLFPLKQEYWTEPTLHYDQADRAKLFTPVFLHPQLNHLLATPTVIGVNNKTQWKATLPIANPNDTKLIERFMYASDQVVDTKAKYAALYTFEKEKRYNWVTQKITEIEAELDKTQYN